MQRLIKFIIILYCFVNHCAAKPAPQASEDVGSIHRSSDAVGFQLPIESDSSIIYFPRDSYGNIVTPFSSLPDDEPRGDIKFVIPSYADGITKVHGPNDIPGRINKSKIPSQNLLPPLSSGNYNYPQTNELNLNIARIGAKQVENTVPQAGHNTFLSNQPQQTRSPIIPIVPQTTILPESHRNTGIIQTIQTVGHNQDQVGTLSNAGINSKYQGGFGGSSGILGQQTNVGFGVKPGQNPPKIGIDTRLDNADIGQNQILNLKDKYTGGFGGPPGVLSPYDNINIK